MGFELENCGSRLIDKINDIRLERVCKVYFNKTRSLNEMIKYIVKYTGYAVVTLWHDKKNDNMCIVCGKNFVFYDRKNGHVSWSYGPKQLVDAKYGIMEDTWDNIKWSVDSCIIAYESFSNNYGMSLHGLRLYSRKYLDNALEYLGLTYDNKVVFRINTSLFSIILGEGGQLLKLHEKEYSKKMYNSCDKFNLDNILGEVVREFMFKNNYLSSGGLGHEDMKEVCQILKKEDLI